MSTYDPAVDPYAVALRAGYRYLGVIDDQHVAEECGPGDGRLECFGLDELFDALDKIRRAEFERGRAKAIEHTLDVARLARDAGHDEAADRLEADADRMRARFEDAHTVNTVTPIITAADGSMHRSRLSIAEWFGGDVNLVIEQQRIRRNKDDGKLYGTKWTSSRSSIVKLASDDTPRVASAILAMSAGYGYAEYRGEHALIDLDTCHIITTFSTVSQLATWCEGRKATR